MADDPLQTKTYSTNTAATSHQLTLDKSISARSTLIIMVSYPGLIGLQVSSVTDTDSGTWNADTTNLSKSNLLGVNGEMLYRYGVTGLTTPTITVNLASSLSCAITVAEFAGILHYSAPLDRAVGRIDITNSTNRTSGASTVRRAPVEVIIGGVAWNSSLITSITNGTSWTTDVFVQNGTSNVGSGIGHRTAESAGIAGSTSNSNFKVSSTATVIPVATLCAAFYRLGVYPTSDQDGKIQNISGVVTVDTTACFVYMSSDSAPFGAAPYPSEKTDSYWFIDLTQYGTVPTSLAVVDGTFNYNVADAFDGGTPGGFRLFTDKSAINGSTLTADDEGRPSTNGRDLANTSTIAGAKSVNLVVATDVLLTNLANVRLSMFTDATAPTSTYSHPSDYTDLTPAYYRLNFFAPVLSSRRWLSTVLDSHQPDPPVMMTMNRRLRRPPTMFRPRTFAVIDWTPPDISQPAARRVPQLAAPPPPHGWLFGVLSAWSAPEPQQIAPRRSFDAGVIAATRAWLRVVADWWLDIVPIGRRRPGKQREVEVVPPVVEPDVCFPPVASPVTAYSREGAPATLFARIDVDEPLFNRLADPDCVQIVIVDPPPPVVVTDIGYGDGYGDNYGGG